jgi:hypothetical protein
MEVNIQSTVGDCSEYCQKGFKNKITVVISPLKVTSTENGDKAKIVTGCNMWKTCENERCYYSSISRYGKVKP